MSSNSKPLWQTCTQENLPFVNETADERKLRLAKEYLSTIEDFTRGEEDDGEVDDDEKLDGLDPVAQRLHREALKLRGKLTRKVADQVRKKDSSLFSKRILRGHRLPVTCVALTSDDSLAYSGSKDGAIIKVSSRATEAASQITFIYGQWDIKAGKKLLTVGRVPKPKGRIQRREIQGHFRAVLCIAVSTDGKLLATGGDDQCLLVWNTENLEVQLIQKLFMCIVHDETTPFQFP